MDGDRDARSARRKNHATPHPHRHRHVRTIAARREEEEEDVKWGVDGDGRFEKSSTGVCRRVEEEEEEFRGLVGHRIVSHREEGGRDSVGRDGAATFMASGGW